MPRFPPPVSFCENKDCEHEPDEDGAGELLRCSACKDRFYCSKKCQKKDWKEHKTCCSPLPLDELEPTKVQDDDPGRKKAVRDFRTLLRAFKTEFEKIEKVAGKGCDYAAFARTEQAKAFLEFTFPESLKYDRLPFEHDKYPYRLPFVLAARAALIQHISQMPPHIRTELARRIEMNGSYMPSSWTRLFGPKVVSRPDSLSPGEYLILTQIGIGLFHSTGSDGIIPLDGLDKEDNEFWSLIAFCRCMLRDAPTRSVIGEA